MASRRDELNAYTFAKKRLVAAFLQPSPNGTEEGAPRPMRAVLPSMVVALVVVVAFGAWGMFKPAAPKGWDKPGEKVIIGSDSTTRYVVLTTDGKKQLHPVLNLTSAKLLLTPDKFGIVKVAEKTLDNGKIPHGATLGIPYAPDRLPEATKAAAKKHWAVCTQPGANGGSVQKAVFVLDGKDKARVEGKNRLRGGGVMYVQASQGGQRYVVDRSGRAYPIADDPNLLHLVVGSGKPQQVTRDWLNTFKPGDKIAYPTLSGIGEPSAVPGNLDEGVKRIGTVLQAASGEGQQYYVVLKDAVKPVTPFTAKLLLNSPESTRVGQNGHAAHVSSGAFTADDAHYGGTLTWPEPVVSTVNAAGKERNTLCNVLRDVHKTSTALSTWAGAQYPAALPNGAASAYVTPGSGLLFRQVKGKDTESGGVFLVTDTGLRYAVQGNDDSDKGPSDIGTDGKGTTNQQQQSGQQGNKAQIRLGYKEINPIPVIPAAWSQFLPTGPRLSTSAARQPQGS